jgi:hypothetical protein
LLRQYFPSGKVPVAIPFLSGLFENLAVNGVSPNVSAITQNSDPASLDTEEKFGASLLSDPEPSPEELDALLKTINSLLPKFRELTLSKAKEFPHARGGAPRKLGSIEDQRKIIEEIKRLRGHGTKLADIFVRVGQKFGVSPSKIKQILSKSPR